MKKHIKQDIKSNERFSDERRYKEEYSKREGYTYKYFKTKEKDREITVSKLIYLPGVKIMKNGKVDGSGVIRFEVR